MLPLLMFSFVARRAVFKMEDTDDDGEDGDGNGDVGKEYTIFGRLKTKAARRLKDNAGKTSDARSKTQTNTCFICVA